MTFLSELRRLGARVLAPMALAAALLAACGGGTSQVEKFRPDRLIVLGDENSMIEDFVDAEGKHDGFKYTLNDRSSTASGKCLTLPIAAQSVAALYGFAFPQCNGAGVELLHLRAVDTHVRFKRCFPCRCRSCSHLA